MDTDKKILEIINNKETFQKEVVDAAYKVAKQRGLELNPDLSVNFNYECIVDIINSDEKNSKRKKKKTNLRLSSFYSFIFGAMILATTLLPNWKNKLWSLFDYDEIPLF